MSPFPQELLAEAARNPGGWVYEIDGDQVADPNGEVPFQVIKGAWAVGDDGQPTGEYWTNDKYQPKS